MKQYQSAVLMQPVAFATSLAVVTGFFALFFFALRVTAPAVFVFVLNSQFFGADVASLFPRHVSAAALVGTACVVVATSWVFAAVWAALYNRWAR